MIICGLCRENPKERGEKHKFGHFGQIWDLNFRIIRNKPVELVVEATENVAEAAWRPFELVVGMRMTNAMAENRAVEKLQF